jgi:hypothetical protein
MKALEDSIAHWELNAAAQAIEDIKLGTDNCHAYYDIDCQGCPVAIRTSQMYSAHTTPLKWPPSGSKTIPHPKRGRPTAEQHKLNFLKSLRTP